MRMLQLAARLLSCGNCEHDDRAKEAEERINFINTFSSPPVTLQPVKLYPEPLAMCYAVFGESVQWRSWHILPSVPWNLQSMIEIEHSKVLKENTDKQTGKQPLKRNRHGHWPSLTQIKQATKQAIKQHTNKQI